MITPFFKNSKIIFYCLIFCTFQMFFGQNGKTELSNKVKIVKQDTLKIKSLIDLGEAIFYIKPDSAYACYKKAMQLAVSEGNSMFEAKSSLKIGQYYNYVEEYKKALEFYIKAIEIYKTVNNKKGIAECYSSIGFSFQYLNSLDKSIEYYLKALEIYKELDYKIGIGDVYNGLGNINYDQENYEKAINYFLKAIDLYEKMNNKEGLLSSYINIGNAIADGGDIDGGIVYYKKSIELTKELDDKEGLAINFINIADCFLEKKDTKTALEYLDKSLEIVIKNDYKSLYATVYEFYSKTYLQMKNYKKTIYYSEKSIENSKNLSWMKPQYENNSYLSEAYAGLGDFKQAYYYHKLFKQNSDSIFNAKKFEQVAKLDVLYDLESKEEKINLLEKSEELNKLKIESQKKLNLTLIFSTIVLLGLFVVLFKQSKAKNKTLELLKIEKEKATESDKLKSAFLANMSHEIRTPMNAIMGFSEFLKNPDLSKEKQTKFVDIITKSGVRLMNIINDIIDISKIESNQLKLELKEVKIIPILNEIVEIQKNTNPLFLAKNIELKINLLNNSDGIKLITDENRFTQVLNNLINNAVKFTEKGSIEVGFSEKEYSNKKYIEFYVKDTGIGIEPNKFDVIFDRFSQAGEKDFKTGNGLGLSISKGILKLLNGDIWLQSKVGEGTTFYFTLPYNF